MYGALNTAVGDGLVRAGYLLTEWRPVLALVIGVPVAFAIIAFVRSLIVAGGEG